MSLRDLGQVVETVRRKCETLYGLKGFSLTADFTKKYLNYIKRPDSKGGYKAVSFDRGVCMFVSSKDNKISYAPQIGFAIAYELVDLYRELWLYREKVISVFPNIKTYKKDSPQSAITAVKSSDFSEQEKTYLCKFLSDYDWWGGGKSIDRLDFSVSPLMKCAGLQAESQSVMEEIAGQFADSQELYSAFSYTSDGETCSSEVDRLSIALRYFKQHRADEDWAGGYRAVNVGVREYFGKLTAEKVAALEAAGLKELFEGVKDAEGKRTFMPMWGGSPGNGYSHVKGAIEGAADEVRAFLVRIQRDTALVSQFTRKDFARPSGFGKSVVSELLMKFHPDSALLYDSKTRDALTFLGSIDFEPTVDFDETEYTRVMGIAADIKSRMADMGIGRTLEDAADARKRVPPDYLTVNEFVAWVVDNKDLIKEKVMEKTTKKLDRKPKTGDRPIADAAKDPLMKRLMAALRTKPFAILAGHSGTGKSRLVRRLAYMTCNDEGLLAEAERSNAPGNYCMVQVKPNWHDSMDLIGYYSERANGAYHTTPFVEFVCKAYAYPDTPFFVCLDEMNLAPVEHYFAEYLSAIESATDDKGVYLTDPLVANTYAENEIMPNNMYDPSKAWFKAHGLTIPKNLFVVGTVNVDETTCQFSRKVLDRAMTILMDEVNFSSMSSAEPKDERLLDPDGIRFFLDGGTNVVVTDTKLLDDLNAALVNTPFVIAYRFAKEFALYKQAIEKLGADATKSAADALDQIVLMKLLPRIHGERAAVKELFTGKDGKGGIAAVLKEGLSRDQMTAILNRKDEYLTFWP